MNIKNIIKSTLACVVILSIPALLTSAQAVASIQEMPPMSELPGSSCKAYYAGQQNRINLYSGTIKAKLKVRVICPLNQIKVPFDSLEEFVGVGGRNVSGETPVCHVIQTQIGRRSVWTKMPVHKFKGYFDTHKVITKRDGGDSLSISCVLSKNDYLSQTATFAAIPANSIR